MISLLTVETKRLISGSLLAVASSFPAAAADMNVPGNYDTIQAAVNGASSGDTIHIAPGVYVEQITIIRKNLTLAGTPGAVIRASTGMSETLSSYDFCTVPLLGVALSDVVIKGLTFEGEHLADKYPCGYGAIMFSGASGRVEDCIVRGFRQASTLSGFDGGGVTAANNIRAPLVKVEVLRSTFADNGCSVHVRGGDAAGDPVRLTFIIADNIIAGIGPTTLGSQIGILISAGASGEVLRNTISDHSFKGETETSFGIFAVDWRFQFGFGHARPIALQPVRYEGNTLQNNQRHLSSALGHGSQFVNNTFQGFGVGRFAGGLALTGDTNRVVGNRFSDMATGITFVGDDPDFHTVYGIAQNPTVVGNQFCQVTAPLVNEPMVTGVTEQGTLLCPFPDPTLTIAPAVLLTWPGYTEGWKLESAANVNGPYTLAGATPSLQGDQITVVVKTDTEHRFFRLRQP